MSNIISNAEWHFDEALKRAKLGNRAFLTNYDLVRAFSISTRSLKRAVNKGELISFRGNSSNKGKMFYAVPQVRAWWCANCGSSDIK